MSKIGTAHVEIKPVINEEALAAVRERIARVVEDALRPVRLLKSQRVLHLRASSGPDIEFANEDGPTFHLDRDSWVEMGEPTVVTLGITPGDLLNVDAPVFSGPITDLTRHER